MHLLWNAGLSYGRSCVYSEASTRLPACLPACFHVVLSAYISSQAFEPEPGTYDVIWIQWVIGHLIDADLVTFFRRCTKALRRGGVICVKDNCFASERREDGTLEVFTVDRADSSVTRSVEYFEALFEICDLAIISRRRQGNFPTELFPVYMFALSAPESS